MSYRKKSLVLTGNTRWGTPAVTNAPTGSSGRAIRRRSAHRASNKWFDNNYIMWNPKKVAQPEPEPEPEQPDTQTITVTFDIGGEIYTELLVTDSDNLTSIAETLLADLYPGEDIVVIEVSVSSLVINFWSYYTTNLTQPEDSSSLTSLI